MDIYGVIWYNSWFLKPGVYIIPLFSKLLILQEYVKKESSGYFTSEAFGLYHFLDIVDIYGVIWYNLWFLNPDRYISLNIFETIIPTRISNRGKFIIISQAKLLVPSTFWLKLIFTELFDTTHGFWILTGTFLSISSKLLTPQESVIEVSLWSFHKLNFWSLALFGQSWYLRSYLIQLLVFESRRLH